MANEPITTGAIPDDVVVRCESCRYFSEDDDGDGHGCCALALNDLTQRGWRTRPDYYCTQWDWDRVRKS